MGSGSNLRIGIVHARWNTKIIDALLEGALQKLKAAGVKGIAFSSFPVSLSLVFSHSPNSYGHSAS